MKTMKNKVDRKLTETWLGKSLIKVGQKVDEVWMGVGQYLVRSWSAFKAKEVGQNLDESWMDFGRERVQQSYNDGTTFLRTRICQGYAKHMPEFQSKRLTQQLPSGYPENEGFSLDKSGQNQDEIGIENCVNASLRVRQFGGCQGGQLLGETWVVLEPFYLEMSLVIQPLSFIAHSLIAHNKRVSYGYTEVTPGIHQEFSLFDIAKLFLYVVLPDQNL
jgi:hypothetical protein